MSPRAMQGVFGGTPVGCGWIPSPREPRCHAPVSLSAVQGVSRGGYGRLPRAGGVWRGPQTLQFFNNECSTRAGRHGDPWNVSP